MSTPAAGGYAVVPARLHAARAPHDAAAQALGEVARVLGGLDLPTGRPDSAEAGADLLRRLSATVRAASDSARTAGVALSAAGHRYASVDRACIGGLGCD